MESCRTCALMIHAGNTTFAEPSPHSSPLAEPRGSVKQGWQFPQNKFSAVWPGLNFHKSVCPGQQQHIEHLHTYRWRLYHRAVCLSTHQPWPKAHHSHRMLFINFNRLWMRSVWSEAPAAQRHSNESYRMLKHARIQISHVNAFLNTNLPQTPCKCTWPDINTPLALN